MSKYECGGCGERHDDEEHVCKLQSYPSSEQQQRLVRRLQDGKVLPVVDETSDEICVEELFDFADGGTPRPLRLWQAASGYESVPPQQQGREGEWVDHIVEEGSREHVTYWDINGTHCSTLNCILNKPIAPTGNATHERLAKGDGE